MKKLACISFAIFCLSYNLLAQNSRGLVNQLNQLPNLETVLDKVFFAYSTCFTTSTGASINWKALKAFAYAESGLNTMANVCGEDGLKILAQPADEQDILSGRRQRCRRDGKYLGLFQMDRPYCASAFAKYAQSSRLQATRMSVHPRYRVDCDDDRANVDTNTAAAAFHLTKTVEVIETRCPRARIEDKLSMLYARHNDGPVVFRLLMGLDRRGQAYMPAACNYEAMKARITDYYTRAIANGTTRVASIQRGVDKLEYGRKRIIPFALRNGVRSLTINLPAQTGRWFCPKDLGQHIYPTLLRQMQARRR